MLGFPSLGARTVSMFRGPTNCSILSRIESCFELDLSFTDFGSFPQQDYIDLNVESFVEDDFHREDVNEQHQDISFSSLFIPDCIEPIFEIIPSLPSLNIDKIEIGEFKLEEFEASEEQSGVGEAPKLYCMVSPLLDIYIANPENKGRESCPIPLDNEIIDVPCINDESPLPKAIDSTQKNIEDEKSLIRKEVQDEIKEKKNGEVPSEGSEPGNKIKPISKLGKTSSNSDEAKSQIPSNEGNKLKNKSKRPFSESDISFIVDREIAKESSFSEIFSNCRIAIRPLNHWDFEISPNDCIIIKKNDSSSVAAALAVFENVHVFGLDFCQDTLSFCEVGRVFVRQVPNISAAFLAIKTMCIPHSFIVAEETLHEYFLSLFSCIPRIMAMKWLKEGNPITNSKIVDRNSAYGHMFSVVLDSKAYIPLKKTRNPLLVRTEVLRSKQKGKK